MNMRRIANGSTALFRGKEDERVIDNRENYYNGF